MQHAQVQEWFGNRTGVYRVLQTLLGLAFFYFVVTYFPHYAGMAFGTLFFTVQDNYVENLQQTLVFTNKIVAVK